MLLTLAKFYLRLRYTKNRLLTLLWVYISLFMPDIVIRNIWKFPRFRCISLNGDKVRIGNVSCYGDVVEHVSALCIMRMSCYLSCFDWNLEDIVSLRGLIFSTGVRQIVINLTSVQTSEPAYILYVNIKSLDGKDNEPQYQLLKPEEQMREWKKPMFGKVQYTEPVSAQDETSLDELEALMNGSR